MLPLIPALIARIAAQVPELHGRVEGAISLARLMAQNALPHQTPAAFAMPGAITGGKPGGIDGLFRQAVQREVTVVLVMRASDPGASRAIDPVELLIERIATAVAAWQPDPGLPPFELRSVRPGTAAGGVLTYDLTFTLADELRIPT